MDIKQYLDSTYLKTAEQANLTVAQNNAVVSDFILEAIEEKFKLIMIRPNHIKLARKMIIDSNSRVLIGTVIDFPFGTSSIENKLIEAKLTIQDGADELDYVVNYEAFKKGNLSLIKEEVVACAQLGIANHKVVKFIIEVAALSNDQIMQIASLIKNTIVANFEEQDFCNIFVKSSTGFYTTPKGLPNGATVPSVLLMLENASPLPIKAAGGVRTIEEAIQMINLGVKRIGTSSAKAIADGNIATEGY